MPSDDPLSSSGPLRRAAARTDPGRSCRVSAPAIAATPLVGTIQELSHESIGLAVQERGVITVPRISVSRLEVSQGRSRRKGALIGDAACAAAGITVGAVGCHDSSDLSSSFLRGDPGRRGGYLGSRGRCVDRIGRALAGVAIGPVPDQPRADTRGGGCSDDAAHVLRIEGEAGPPRGPARSANSWPARLISGRPHG